MNKHQSRFEKADNARKNCEPSHQANIDTVAKINSDTLPLVKGLSLRTKNAWKAIKQGIGNQMNKRILVPSILVWYVFFSSSVILLFSIWNVFQAMNISAEVKSKLITSVMAMFVIVMLYRVQKIVNQLSHLCNKNSKDKGGEV